MLAAARAAKRAEDDQARAVMKAAAAWAAMHSAASLVGPADSWHEAAEFAVVELAAALGRSTESGRRYLSRAVEAFYRLRRCWARLGAGDLTAWRLCFVAERTLCLSTAAAAFVDQHVASVAHKVGPAQLDRLITEAKARLDPDQAEADRGPTRLRPGSRSRPSCATSSAPSRSASAPPRSATASIASPTTPTATMAAPPAPAT